MQPVRIDIDQLADYIQWKMDEEDLSIRTAAHHSKVSPSTLSRILQKGKKRPRPDVDTLTKLIRWVDIPIEKIIETQADQKSEKKTTKNTIEEIQVHLRADKNLSPEAAQAIAHIVKVAYAQFARRRRG